jgi:DNA-binding transcriptional ArsR family regulator
VEDQVVDALARYFRALSEPLRLKILDALRTEPQNVGQLTQLLGCSQANVSKHLSVLMEAGLVEREPRGTTAWYRFADPEVYELCDLVCGQVGRRLALGGQLRGLLTAMAERHRG